MVEQFLWEYRYVIVVVAVAILYSAFEWKSAKEKAYALMLQAKSLAKNLVLNSGKEQEDWVVKKAYEYLPKSITIFITEEKMRKLIQYLYNKAKDYLDDGTINNSN